MSKELELEAEQFYPIKTDDLICSPKLVRDAFIAGARSKYVEKQKLEFAIEQLKKIKIAISDKNPFTLYNIKHQIEELQKQLEQL